MSGILAFLVALPRLLTLMERLGRALSDSDVLTWMQTLESTVDKLEKAQSKDEKIKAAQNLVSLIGALK